MSKLLPKFNFKTWIDDNRHLLKPPVGNKAVWQNQDYIVMVVGGPNTRKDYHVNHTPEFFYQVEGGITLKVMDEGEPKDVNIEEGEIYLLPAGIPHSPRRGPNTIGLVIEQRRPEGMEDALVYFCENCGTKMYEEAFTLQNIETDLPTIFDNFFGSKNTKCPNCGEIMERPSAPKV
ncbi:MAG: 3-hydroxyanthranilate 3,4-dioxygenase [Saprospiraceae bacterium]